MADDEARIISLFPDDDSSEALKRWVARLGPYLDERSEVQPLRRREMPERPWPDSDSPMLGYLIDHAREVLRADGEEAAVVWLAVHAWFEGALEERFQLLRDVRP